MQILKTQILRGPNIWSIDYKNLVQIRLDVGDAVARFSQQTQDFAHRLSKVFPEAGSIEIKSPENAVLQIAMLLQKRAGMSVNFSTSKETKENGIFLLAFAYTDEKAGRFAARRAVTITEKLLLGEDYDIADDILDLQEICEYNCLGPSTQSIVNEALKRDIPWFRLGSDSTVQLGLGSQSVRVQATITGRTSALATSLAGNKKKTKEVLSHAYIPVAGGGICAGPEGLRDIIDDIGYPIVLKPLDGNHGKGVSIDINDFEAAVAALEFAKKFSHRVIVEKFVKGFDF
ncbi:MAG TPA: cyanophycin synthetase, partial [Flavobacterium sp.]